MAYNATMSTPSEEIQAGFMDTGIHENAELTRIEFGVSPKGNKFLAFYFVNENGEIGSHTEWEPNATDPTKQAEKELNQMSRVKQIAMIYLTPEQFVFQANSFEDFAKKVVDLLIPRIKGVKVRVKFVYSGNYTSLPTYWKFRFIERMDTTPKDKSKIKVLSIDTMIKPTADPIPQAQNPFVGAVNAQATPNVPDALPF